jgi:hypothetical protein
MAFMTMASSFPSKRYKRGIRRLAAALPDAGAAAIEGSTANGEEKEGQGREQVSEVCPPVQLHPLWPHHHCAPLPKLN